jgi:hypothetical protein
VGQGTVAVKQALHVQHLQSKGLQWVCVHRLCQMQACMEQTYEKMWKPSDSQPTPTHQA